MQRLVEVQPDRSSSRNSGRSFGRQLISTSWIRCEHDAALRLHARGDRLALEVDRQTNLQLLVLHHALQIHMHHGIRAGCICTSLTIAGCGCASTFKLMMDE